LTVKNLLDIEMTCESVEDDCSSSSLQELDTGSETLLPRIVNVMSLSSSQDNSEHNSSLVFPVYAFPTSMKRPVSPPISQVPLKCQKTNMKCNVLLEKLPERLLQAAPACKILVSTDNFNKLFLKSSSTDETAAFQTFQLQDQTVKTEPDEVEDPQASVLHPRTLQHSATVNFTTNVASTSYLRNNSKLFYPHYDHTYVRQTFRKVATMTDAAPPNAAVRPSMSLCANSSSARSDGVERDVSVILLKSAQLPKTSVSNAAHKAAIESRDVSKLVMNMLQQQNVSVLPANNNSVSSEMQNENEERGKTHEGSSHAEDEAVKLRMMLRVADRAKTALETKLKAEQAKVKYLLAEVSSLKLAVKHLSKNLTNAEGTNDDNSSAS